jgi:hypothetical protein
LLAFAADFEASLNAVSRECASSPGQRILASIVDSASQDRTESTIGTAIHALLIAVRESHEDGLSVIDQTLLHCRIIEKLVRKGMSVVYKPRT